MTITPKLNEAIWVLMPFHQVRLIVSETDYGASSTRLIEWVVRQYVASIISEESELETPDTGELSDSSGTCHREQDIAGTTVPSGPPYLRGPKM